MPMYRHPPKLLFKMYNYFIVVLQLLRFLEYNVMRMAIQSGPLCTALDSDITLIRSSGKNGTAAHAGKCAQTCLDVAGP